MIDIAAISRQTGVPYYLLYDRLRADWDLEDAIMRPPKPQNKCGRDFDAGLDMLLAGRVKGERFDQSTIARACHCTRSYIDIIEKRALRKVREHLRKEMGMEMGQFMAEGKERMI